MYVSMVSKVFLCGSHPVWFSVISTLKPLPLFFAFLAWPCIAKENNDVPNDTNDPPQQQVKEKSGRLKKSTDYLGDKYLDIIYNLDMFLSKRIYEREKNNSHLSLNIGNTWFESGDTKSDFRLRAKAHFPGTSERTRLFIETDPDETSSLEDRSRPISTDQLIKKGNSIAGIEYAKEAALTQWKQSASLGGDLDGGLNLLVRYRVRKYWALSPLWTAGFRQDFWHRGNIGWGETSYTEFTRPLGHTSWLHIESAIELREHDSPLEYMNAWRIHHRPLTNWGFSYRMSFFGDGPLENLINDRALSASAIYKIPKQRLYFYVTPEIYFAEERNYNPRYSITLKLRFDVTE